MKNYPIMAKSGSTSLSIAEVSNVVGMVKLNDSIAEELEKGLIWFDGIFKASSDGSTKLIEITMAPNQMLKLFQTATEKRTTDDAPEPISNNKLRENKLFDQVWGKYGPEKQIIVLIEEFAELQKELCKAYRRDDFKPQNVDEHLLEELADCDIMLSQLKNWFFRMEYNYETFSRYREEKLQRLAKRLNE
jgi:NTP pyrophosphatase (non-canonical NTP hydrolase)